jgi:aminoglycoside phosphotransferase (APT) family kinase protein
MEEALGRSLAAGNTAEIFEWGPRVMKLYKSPVAKRAAFHEAATSVAVESLGLPVPRVWGVHEVGGRWGVVFDRVAQKSFADQMLGNSDDVPRYLECMVRLHIRIHSRQAIQFAGLKIRLSANIATSTLLDKPRRQSLLEAIAEMPDGDRLCHGDFHPLNILGDTAGPMIIDWPDARRGDCAADVCRSYLLLRLHFAEIATAYLDAYCRLSNMDREAALRWLPYVAAAKLAEGVPGERDGLLEIIGSSPTVASPST